MAAKLLLATILFFSSLSPASAKLQYFGYYNVNGLDPMDNRDHIPEIGARGNSNIGVITVSDISKLPQYLREMRQYKMYAILGVTAMFEQPRRQEIWASIKNTIKGYEDVVYGFYFDESASRGIGVNEFRSYTKQIRDDFPDKATILVEGVPPIIRGTLPDGYLEYITDFGIDYYPTAVVGDFHEGDTTKFDQEWGNYIYYYHLFSRYSAGKKVWLVPDGYGYPNVSTDYLTIALQRYYRHALAHPEVIGMLVFIYDFGDRGFYTVRDAMNPSSKFYNPGVLSAHNNIGRAIIANAPPYPSSSPSPTPKPGDLNGNGSVNLLDFNLLIAKFGNPYTLLDFNAIIGNYGQ